jgi:hypothetical protein
MLTKSVLALVFLILTGVQVHANGSDLQQIADALDVSRTRTFQFTATGKMFAVGQSTSPMAAWPRYYVKSLTRAYDFTAGAMRDEMVRMQGETPPAAAAASPSKVTSVWLMRSTAITPGTKPANRWCHDSGTRPNALTRL